MMEEKYDIALTKIRAFINKQKRYFAFKTHSYPGIDKILKEVGK